jgi:pimeloyl-ACP methyl ester carboxylesterase
MSKYTHVDAPTQYVESNGFRYAYRRFGAESGTPVLFLQHFRGGLDHWDPAVTDGLGTDRPVILFANAGVGGSSGDTPDTIEDQADHAAAFVNALGLSTVDVLGFSIGGFVAQALTLRHPALVRKLILAGTMPRGGTLEGSHPDNMEVATRHEVPTLEDFLFLFFEPSDSSQAAGRAFWERRHQRTLDLDPPSSMQTMKAQGAAAVDWHQPLGEPYSDLERIAQPTLVVNGSHDIMLPTINSYVLAQHLPDAQLIIYPDSGHGAIFQHANTFVRHASQFLDD